jgi:hypothetical protein
MKQGNGKCMVKVTKGAIGECNPQGSQTCQIKRAIPCKVIRNNSQETLEAMKFHGQK